MYKSLCARFPIIGGVPSMNEVSTQGVYVCLSQALTHFCPQSSFDPTAAEHHQFLLVFHVVLGMESLRFNDVEAKFCH